MPLKVRPKALPHLFMPGQTVVGAIKLANRHNVTQDEVKLLIQQFKDINGEINPKPGMRLLLPILERHQSVVFKES